MRTSGIYGFSAVNQSQNPQLSGNFNINKGRGSLFSARVISIVLDDSHPRFTELGGWNALGVIEYDPTLSLNYNLTTYPVAYPIKPNIKNFPLINETIIIYSAFSSEITTYENGLNIISGAEKMYYDNVINVWNNKNHNGYSFVINNSQPSQNKSYSQIEAGSSNTTQNKPSTINLGKTFKERPDIHPLLPFEGDVIYEGRWGNSIRFGSTVKNPPSKTIQNNWSNKGTDGDPIIIIRNGQGESSTPAFEPITENIENNDSSIYLTSTQQIPLKASSPSYVSYTKSTPPTSPDQYAGPQIILNSGRLVFNTYSDHIILSSAKSINLNSQESVNIDTKKFITQADKIFLGTEDLAKEPLLLGDTTAQVLRDLVSSVKELAAALQVLVSAPVIPFTPAVFPTLLVPATKVLSKVTVLQTQLGLSKETCTITSKRNFTV
jgi:hypothetical protein